MIWIENPMTYGWEEAIRGMRNPMNSWEKSDSVWCDHEDSCHECRYRGELHCPGISEVYNRDVGGFIGPNDLTLMQNLVKAGSDHAKFMRMLTVYMDITAPLYWWKEYDTYKVGTVANSCSTMHKIHAKEFTVDDFSHEHLFNDYERHTVNDSDYLLTLEIVIDQLNDARDMYLNTNDKKYWWQMIQLLPSSYNQRRTVQLNYAVLRNMYHARKNHKLDEWRTFCDYIKNNLPYAEELICS